ncbi:ABC transporter substrate-binding protein [Nocardia sp. NBC_00565]|uniref:ABC transporter substrate-binding protein n=1 Tax=Nocardia sp. NBC_00565 TaxID=2975993 RepID=UPI002E812017|nr:ABC transporter substrate-binding protein [Nocardia sp. NBC_00565]WUC03502.1 ABC transporter substrate-binding protein [Nocardia sp. NBC_00565]
MRVKTHFRTITAAVATVLALAGATACSTGTDPGSSAGSTSAEHTDDISVGIQPDPAAVALLPDAVKAKGTLEVPMDLTSPPTTFMASDNKTPIGFNPDIARLIAKKLGLDLKIDNVKFATVIPGLQAGRYDFTASTMGPTSDRLEVLDMIDYFANGTGVLVPAGNPQHLSMDSLCGNTIGVQSGTTQEIHELPQLSKTNCESKSKPAIKAVSLPSVNDALTQVASKRIDGVFYDSTSLSWAAMQQPKTFEVLQPVLDTVPVALALNKNSPLTPAVQKAMQSIIDSPEYNKALHRWGFDDLGVKEAIRSKAQD